MIEQYHNYPFYLPFKFTSAAEGTVNQVTLQVPFNMAVYGICVSTNTSIESGFYNYTLEFLDYLEGTKLFDEPIQGFNIQTDCRTYWPLPSKWFLKKSTKLICNLNPFDATFSSAIDTVTYYVTLLCHLTAFDPNPGVQPFVYSFRGAVGWQDQVEGGGASSVPMTQGLTTTVAKEALYDFDLHSVVLDAWTEESVFDHLPILSFQVTAAGKKLFDRMVINGVAGGGNNYNQGNTALFGNTTTVGYPRDNNVQYFLPRTVRVPKGCLMRVDFSPAPTYIPSGSIHAALNQICCMALVGNHIA